MGMRVAGPDRECSGVVEQDTKNEKYPLSGHKTKFANQPHCLADEAAKGLSTAEVFLCDRALGTPQACTSYFSQLSAQPTLCRRGLREKNVHGLTSQSQKQMMCSGSLSLLVTYKESKLGRDRDL